MKKRYLAILATSLIILGGCDVNSEDRDCRYKVETYLDQGEVGADKAIKLMESSNNCNTAYKDKDANLALGSAYLSRAGFNLKTLVDLANGSNDTNASSALNDPSALLDKFKDIDLSDLDKALTNFKVAFWVGDEWKDDCSADTLQNPDFDSGKKATCLFIGLSTIMKTASSLSLLSNGLDIGTFLNPDLSIEEKGAAAQAITCALEYSIKSSNLPGNTPLAYKNDENGTYYECALKQHAYLDTNTTFDSGREYEHIHVVTGYDANSTKSETTYYLVSIKKAEDLNPARSNIITDGNCSVSFVKCDTANNTDCYACPVSQSADDNELATTDIILDTLNGGLDTISAFIPDSGDANSTNPVDDYKQQIIDSRTDGNTSTTITEQDLINYLNSQSAGK